MNQKGFSLIELSIVLIIIGLLIAGVTGGASLIESARIRSIINEINQYRQAVFIFKASKGRYPGDLNNLGKFGNASGHIYSNIDFPTPYDGSNSNYGIPKNIIAPFVDLYLDGIIDFKPVSTDLAKDSQTYDLANAGALPYSKSIPNSYIYYEFVTYSASGTSTNFKYKAPEGNYVSFRGDYSKMNPKMIEKIDEKTDDGIYNSGKMRSLCAGSSYSNAIQTKSYCTYFVNFIE